MNEEKKLNGKSNSPAIEKAISNIKTAWVAGVIIGGLSLIMLIVSFFIKDGAIYSGVFLFLAVWILGFSYGIYKKSRTCSIIMLVLWVIVLFNFAIRGQVVSALVAAIICYPFYKGVIGTIAYHKLDIDT